MVFEENNEVEEMDHGFLMFLNSGFGVMVEEGANGGGGGEGKINGGGGGDGNDYEDDESSMDLYYRNMIEANLGNAMLLSNYANYLKEVYIFDLLLFEFIDV